MTEGANEVVARNVRRIREARDWSQTDVARLCGWHKNVQSKIEAAERRITVDDLLRLAASLHVAPVWLLAPWTQEDPRLEVQAGGFASIALDSEEAQRWLVGDQPIPVVTDPRDYYWTSPPAQRSRRDAILERLKKAGVVSFPDRDTVVFHFSGVDRAYKLSDGDAGQAE